MRRVLFALAFLASPAAAQWATPPSEATNVPPTRYRADIVREVRQIAYDPRSIRDAQVSAPFLRNMGVLKRYVVCFRFNGANTYGGRTGIQDYMAVYVAGEFSSIRRADDGECRGQPMSRFAELERLR